jgi:hypothetical protein
LKINPHLAKTEIKKNLAPAPDADMGQNDPFNSIDDQVVTVGLFGQIVGCGRESDEQGKE